VEIGELIRDLYIENLRIIRELGISELQILGSEEETEITETFNHGDAGITGFLFINILRVSRASVV
jgi:hypothetical protein